MWRGQIWRKDAKRSLSFVHELFLWSQGYVSVFDDTFCHNGLVPLTCLCAPFPFSIGGQQCGQNDVISD